MNIGPKCPHCMDLLRKGGGVIISCRCCGSVQHNGCWWETFEECSACHSLQPGKPRKIIDLESSVSAENTAVVLLNGAFYMTALFCGFALCSDQYEWALICILLACSFGIMAKTISNIKKRSQTALNEANRRYEELKKRQEPIPAEETKKMNLRKEQGLAC